MRKALLVALISGSLTCAFSADSLARGGRGARGGVVMGPYGPLYDTRSPEWRMSGGNIFAYQQIMQAKMELQREQFMLKQMQQAQKLQDAQTKSKGKNGSGSQTQGQTNARALQPQSNQPVWLDEFGQPIVNHYHRPRNRAPSATKSTTGKPSGSTTEQSPTTRRDSLRTPN